MAKKSINKIQLINDANQCLVIYGIVSSEPDYKLSVLINQTLGKSLQSSDPVVTNTADKTTIYSRFTDKSDLPHSSISLIQNRSEKQNLLKKFPNIDYLLVSSVERRIKEEEETFSSLLRTVRHITAVFVIDKERVETSVLEAIMPGY